MSTDTIARPTPGPWRVVDDDIHAADGTHVVCFGHDYDEYGYIAWSADACLIAASPDLLAALKQFVADHELSGHYCEGLNAAYTQAIEAIRKAEGGR